MAKDNDPETVNKRMPIYGGKLDVVGPAATDDEVQRETGDQFGQDLTDGPESDVQAALRFYREGPRGPLDRLVLIGLASKAIFTHGERHIDPEDWAQLGLELGPAAVDLIKQLVALVK